MVLPPVNFFAFLIIVQMLFDRLKIKTIMSEKFWSSLAMTAFFTFLILIKADVISV